MKKQNCLLVVLLTLSHVMVWGAMLDGYTWRTTTNGVETAFTALPDYRCAIGVGWNSWERTDSNDPSAFGAGIPTDFQGAFYIPTTLSTWGYMVSQIGYKAFYNCTGMTSVGIPYTITFIDYSAFSGCTGLKSVVIPGSVTKMDWYTFYGCTNLESVTLSDGIKIIGNRDFYNCSSLSSIDIPASVTSIESKAFGYDYSTKLTSVTVNWETPIAIASDEVNMPFPNAKNSTLYVPIGTVELYSNAEGWKEFKYIKEAPIKFADATVKALCVANWDTDGDGEICKEEAVAVTSLGSVFRANKSISSFDELSFFSGLSNIGSYAFSGCSGLTTVTIPNSVTSIDYQAFNECSGLTSVTIPNGVTGIGSLAFYHCSSLIEVTIPNSLKYISDYAFRGCNGLISITIPNSVTSIGEGAFYDCVGLKTAVIGNGVIKIDKYAFEDCTNLSSVDIGINVTTLGKKVFASCSSLVSVTIPKSVTSLGEEAFIGCSSLNSLVIDNSVMSIGSYAFQDCSGLTLITIPNSVTKIDSYAFKGCNSLASVSIGSGVTTIGYYPFSDCNSLASIVVDENNTIFDSRNNCNAIIETASNTLVAGCKTTNIPTTIKSIGHSAFSHCSGLTSITIPNSVTSIGGYAFSGCSGLTSITIPNSVTSIGDYAFAGCSGLEKVIVSDIAAWCRIPFGNSSANPLYYAHHLYSNVDTEITELTIPNSVRTIGNYAFNSCISLTSIDIPNSVTSIGSSTFSGCSCLTSVDIPNSVTSIGSSTFSGCSGLTSVTIPHSVTSIGGSAFFGCSGLTSITIPNSVTSIGGSAFFGCSGLTSIDIPNSVTSIGASAFRDCSGLTSLTIGTGVTSIRNYAFSGCSLTAFICKATTPPTLGSNNIFDSKKIIYVPFKSIEAYKSTWIQLAEPDYTYLPLADVMFFEKQTAESYAEGMKDKIKTGVTSVAFYEGGLDADLTEAVMKSGMNPNCLYYVPADAGLTGDNIISLDSYEASKVSLTDSYPFDCPIPFHASEIEYVHNPSVWANGSAGWETICLPFAPHSYKASGRGYISPIMLGTKGNFWLRKYVGASSDAVYFSSTLDGKMEANTPYLVAFPGSTMGTGHLQGQTITFLGSNADIDVTQQPEVRNNDYVFVGNYDTTADGTEGWALNAAGSSFVKSGTVGDKPFCAYFKNMAGDAATSRLQISFDETTDIEGLKDAQTDITITDGGNGTLVVQSGTSRMLSIYKTDGRLERSIQLRNGENHIEGLNKGVYIIDNQKVLVR